MKKLVTLSAVALAGATVGVGSTFGWWPAEELKPQPPQVAQETPAELKIEFVQPVEAGKDSGDSQIDIIGDLPTHQPKIAFIQKLDPASGNLAKLAKELEQEASELDKKGQKEAAEEKRTVARRIREALPKVTIGIGQGPGPKWLSRVGEPGKPGHESPASAVEREIHRLHEALNTTDDPALKEKLKDSIQALKMKLQHIQANGPQSKVQHFELRDPNQGPPGHPGVPQTRHIMALGEGPGGGHPFVIEELRKVADNLQREGHPDQARAIREQIERIEKQVQEARAKQETAEPKVRDELAKARRKGRDDKNQIGTSLHIPLGMRVVSLSAADLGGTIEASLEPGDRIAISVRHQSAEVSGIIGNEQWKEVIDAARVFAVQQNRDEEESPPTRKTKLVEIALLVTPEQAQALFMAKSIGPLRLTVRNPDKPEIASGQGIHVDRRMSVSGHIELDGLQRKLSKLFPSSSIDLSSMPSGEVRIKLQAPDSKEASQILQIAHGEILIQQGNREIAKAEHPEQDHAHVSPDPNQIRGLLRALHHDITELRSEVRELRRVIKAESQDDKRDPEVRTERKDKDGEQKEINRGDQDERSSTDDLKKPVETSEDKPQLDD